MLISLSRKSRPPSSTCTGSEFEMITPGGEICFITRLINQSSHPGIQKKVQWWSSMLGKLSSVGVVIERLKKKGCTNWAVTEFVQGSKTRRWGVAWSWCEFRPGVGIARGITGRALKGGTSMNHAVAEEEKEVLDGGLLPFPSEFEFELKLQDAKGMDEVAERLNTELNNLDLQWQWKPALRTGLGIAATGDCWSRKARRRKKQQKTNAHSEDEEMQDCVEEEEEEEEEGKEPDFVFKICVKQSPEHQHQDGKGNEKAGGVSVTIRWLQGHDHVLFESFGGWLRRRLLA
jgi:23S rRNA (adenine1618-N6)-methyltransferase